MLVACQEGCPICQNLSHLSPKGEFCIYSQTLEVVVLLASLLYLDNNCATGSNTAGIC